MSAKTLAVSALVDRLRVLLPDMRARAMVGDRTDLFEDNLLSGLAPWQAAVLRAQLEQGDGGELQVSPAGQLPDAHAPTCPRRWRSMPSAGGSEARRTCASAGSAASTRCGSRRGSHFPGRSGAEPRCAGYAPGVAAGVESKLTEPLAGHPAKAWRPAYSREECGALFTGGWRETLDAAIAGNYATRFLDVDQLLKHALGLNKQYPTLIHRHLVYVYWEPTNADELTEVRAHRGEVTAFTSRVAGSPPSFHAMTYDQLWAEWSRLGQPAWADQHVRQDASDTTSPSLASAAAKDPLAVPSRSV